MRYSSLQDKVVVITGASSGIGKLTAEECVKRGANIVLAARSLKAMQQHLSSLKLDHNRALAIQTDVSDAKQVQILAEQAIRHFGKVHIWINNAAISIYAPFELLDPDEISRVIDVNLKGQLYGSREAIRLFKQQGYGNLINVSSTLGKTAAPLQAIYTASKHGIVGFSSALREELINHPIYKHIAVSVILPASMDTPFFKHAKSKLGVEPYPIPPIYHPQVAVQAILKNALNPKPEVVAGGAGLAMIEIYRLFPSLLEKYMGKVAVQQQQTHIPKAIEWEDNLYTPMPSGIRGGIGTTGEHLAHEIKQRAVPITLLFSIPLILLGVRWVRKQMASAQV